MSKINPNTKEGVQAVMAEVMRDYAGGRISKEHMEVCVKAIGLLMEEFDLYISVEDM